MTRAERQAARLQLGPAAVITEAAAVELLPVSDARARAWLRERGLVRQVEGLGRVVVWGEVLAAVSGLTDPSHTQKPAKLPRKRLRRTE